jgi:hypothetical protein
VAIAVEARCSYKTTIALRPLSSTGNRGNDLSRTVNPANAVIHRFGNKEVALSVKGAHKWFIRMPFEKDRKRQGYGRVSNGDLTILNGLTAVSIWEFI